MSPEEAEKALEKALSRMRAAALRKSSSVFPSAEMSADDKGVPGFRLRLRAWLAPKQTG